MNIYSSLIHVLLSLLCINLASSKEFLYDYVTCGSIVKLLNNNYRARLHSHEVQYGSGSGQQSVTAIEDMDDSNSHWFVKGVPGKPCSRGTPIKCGTDIRLEHLATKRNLHSHHFRSPLSGSQEVSAFGNEGEGDTGDYWTVICEDVWIRNDAIMFKHVDTSKYLSLSGQTYGSPIPGQMEVCATSQPETSAYWKTSEGIYIKPSEMLNSKSHGHTEL